MACNCCHGDEAIHYQDANNSVFVDSKGEMMVTIAGNTMRFNVERCPKCGHLFGANYLNLRHGDDIWYADDDENIVEHGTIHHVLIKNNKVDTFSVNFDDGTFDEFDGCGLGVHYFLDEMSARDALVRNQEEFIGKETSNDEKEDSNKDGIVTGMTVYYVDVDADEMFVDDGVVEYIHLDNGFVDWMSVKFANGDSDEFGPCAIDNFIFKTREKAEEAWLAKHGVKS